jgi:amidase
MDLAEYATADATTIAELVRGRQVSVGEVLTCAATAAERVNPTVNAVLEVYADVVDDADTLELGTGPFAGVPTMLKDLFHGEAGRVCEQGSRLGEGWVVGRDSEFTRRVRRAGLISLGRTTTSEFGILGTTETLAAGRTCTPWSAEHSAGGSSGGAASAVGAGVVPIATASDGGGSIRIPAAACGVVGLKPSRGRITWGPDTAYALLGWAEHFVVSRTVRDTAAMLDALAGPAPGDPYAALAPDRPFAAEVGAPVEPLRVAVWTQPWSGHDPDPEVAEATVATARVLEALGHHVVGDTPHVPWESFFRAMTMVWAADNAHTVDGFAAVVDRPVSLETVEPTTLAAVELGRRLSAQDLMDAFDTANLIARRMGAFFADVDVLLTPTLGRLPARLGTYEPEQELDLAEMFAAWMPWESFLPVINATGQPAISLPLQHSTSGLPIGMHLVSRIGADAVLLRLSAQLEQALPWRDRRPPLHAAAVAPVPG